VCRYFKEDATVSLSDSEVLIRDSLCLPQVVSRQGETGQSLSPIVGTSGIIAGTPHIPGICPKLLNQLVLKFNVPRGKIPQIMGVINFLQSKFQSLAMEIKASNGSLSESEFADKIKEALQQLGIEIGDQ
jgi:hypothetical protein